MLTRHSGAVIAAANATPIVDALGKLLDAEVLGTGDIPAWGASTTTLGLGQSTIEILTPTGVGPVKDLLSNRAAGVFGAGSVVADMNAFTARMDDRGIAYTMDGDRCLLLDSALACPALHLIVTEDSGLPAYGGLGDFIYEFTYLVDDADAMSAHIADTFGLDQSVFHPISSSMYGYHGHLTLFRPGHLHRFEVITPNKPETTMGRFYKKFGQSVYMFYLESSMTGAIVERMEKHAPKLWNTTDIPWLKSRAPHGPDNLFLHPKATGGILIGISATEHAWTWSGDPKRAHDARTRRTS